MREEKIQQILQLGWAYMEDHVPERTSRLTLLRQQFQYISPLYWAAHLVLLVAAAAACFLISAEEADAGRAVFLCSLTLGTLAFPEIIKDALFDMSELEGVCKNSSGRIISLRMLAVGLLDILSLTLLTAAASAAWQASFLWLILYGVTPFLWMHGVDLLLVRLLRLRSRQGYVILDLVTAAVFWEMPVGDRAFAESGMWSWGIALAMAVILLGTEIVLILRERSVSYGVKG